jgi:hypothetical protein
MNATPVAIDLAKDVFQLALVDAQWRLSRKARLRGNLLQPASGRNWP